MPFMIFDAFPKFAVKVGRYFPNLPMAIILLPTILVSPPNIIIAGPIIATIPATLIIVSFCASDNPLNFSANSCNHWVAFFTYGTNLSPKEIAMLSKVDLSIVSCPCRLSFAISYISLQASVELLIPSVNLAKSLSEELTIAKRPAIPVCPAKSAAYSVLSASVSFAKAPLVSDITVAKFFILPSESTRDNPSASIAFCDCFVGFAILVSQERSAVPELDALIPLFAIKPSATDTSSTLYLSAPATGATYLNVSPSIPTSVFDLFAVCARTSTNFCVSLAFIPKAVKASVTMSEVCAKSSPVAPARYIIPSMPSIISSASHPAIAM